MKKLMTIVLFAALALTGFARGDEPTQSQTATSDKKPAAKKVTTEELGDTLDKMGYSPRPSKNKEGKVTGYYVDVTRGSTTITVYIGVSSSGTNLWLDTNMITFDEKNPATTEMLLAFFATQDQLWPAYLVYYPKTKLLQMALSMDAAGFGPTALRAKLDSVMDKFQIVADAYKTAKAAEQKAQQAGKPDANPLP